MRRIQRISLLALALAAASACLLASGAAASPQKCAIKLRVNVFATSPGGNWALQGALNAGSLAHVRAVASGGCTVDHIRGRWLSGPTGTIGPKQCGGAPPCIWKVRGNRQSAAAFQAFSTSSGTTVKSNIVRVAWAGACTRIGEWRNDVAGGLNLTTFWTIERGGAAQEAGGGAVSGMAELNGHVLTIVWASPDQVTTGVYEWTLGPNCRSGQGTLRITAPASRVGESHPTKVTKV